MYSIFVVHNTIFYRLPVDKRHEICHPCIKPLWLAIWLCCVWEDHHCSLHLALWSLTLQPSSPAAQQPWQHQLGLGVRGSRMWAAYRHQQQGSLTTSPVHWLYDLQFHTLSHHHCMLIADVIVSVQCCYNSTQLPAAYWILFNVHICREA